MTDNASAVAVVIVSWNAEKYLSDCLDSVRRQTHPPRELLVVDNASTDRTVAVLAKHHPEVRAVLLSDNEGFCRANNRGIAQTDSPFVLVLNPDTRLEPDFLERLLPAFDDSRVGTAAGKLFRMDGRTLDSCGLRLALSRQPKDRGYGRNDRGRYDSCEEVFGACGAAAMYRRRMLESIAESDGVYFDERFFAFYEDLDLSWRARRHGWKAIYRPDAVGYHARGGSAAGPIWRRRLAAMLGRPAEVRYHVVKNRYLTLIKNESIAGYLAHLPFIWGRDAATLALLGLTSPGVLLRLWRSRGLFWQAWRRRLDAPLARHQFEQGGPGRNSPG